MPDMAGRALDGLVYFPGARPDDGFFQIVINFQHSVPKIGVVGDAVYGDGYVKNTYDNGSGKQKQANRLFQAADFYCRSGDAFAHGNLLFFLQRNGAELYVVARFITFWANVI